MGTAAEPKPQRMDARTFWERSRDLGRSELVHGEVREMAPTGWEHGRVEAVLASSLVSWARGSGALVVSGEVGYQLATDEVRGADVAVHLSPPERPEAGWMTDMPDVLVEIASPNDRWNEVEEKVLQYLDAGVREVWVVSPTHRTVSVRTTSGARMLRGRDVLTSPLLERFELPLGELFGDQSST